MTTESNPSERSSTSAERRQAEAEDSLANREAAAAIRSSLVESMLRVNETWRLTRQEFEILEASASNRRKVESGETDSSLSTFRECRNTTPSR